MALVVAIKPLDGPGGYLRWKESLLLRAHSLGVARVLFQARPAGYGGEAASKWAHDDAVCRGHILAALSDRLLPDYARFATAADLWRALERTYGVHMQIDWEDKFNEFCFDKSPGDVFLEQLAHVEALGAAAGLKDDALARAVCKKLPPLVSALVTTCLGPCSDANEKQMDLVWKISQALVSSSVGPEHMWKEMPEDQEGCNGDGPKPEENAASRKRGMPGRIAKNCRRKA